MSKEKQLLELFVTDQKQLEIIQNFLRLQQSALRNPLEFWAKNAMVGFEIMGASFGYNIVEPERGDRRFSDAVWGQQSRVQSFEARVSEVA